MRKNIKFTLATFILSIMLSSAFANQCLEFTGTTQVVNMGQASLSQPWTLEFWVRREDAGVGASTEKFLSNVTDAAYVKLKAYNDTCFGLHPTSFNAFDVPTTQWVHLSVVSGDETGKATLYVDGTAVQTISSTMKLPLDVLGGNMKGKVDELRVWNDARTETEIRGNRFKTYADITDKNNLYLYYDFNQTTGTNLPDLSGNGRNATLSNMTDANWVTEALPTPDPEIAAYDAIADIDGGHSGAPTYADSSAVIAALPTTATISGTIDTTPITGWVDTDSYNPAVSGSYTFTGTFGTIPTGYTDNIDPISTITAEVVVAVDTSAEGYGVNFASNVKTAFSALPALTGDWTIELWVKSDNASSNGILFSDASTQRLGLNRNGSVGVSHGGSSLGSGVAISTGVWAHISWVYDDTAQTVTVT